MEAPWPHGGLWGLALLPPTLLLAALCARCRRPRGHGAHVDNYDYKPPPCVPPTTFRVIPPHRYPSQAPPQQPPPWGPRAETLLQLPSPQPPQSRRVSVAHPEPGPRDPPTPPEGDDDDYSNEPYATGYVKVLPEPAAQDETPPEGGGGAEAAPSEEYENVPEGARGSLADSLEYINVPPGGSSPHDASESEDCGPDYENL